MRAATGALLGLCFVAACRQLSGFDDLVFDIADGGAAAGATGTGAASSASGGSGGGGTGATGGSGASGGSGSGGATGNAYRVFVTSETASALFGADIASALQGADTLCADAAAKRSLGGTWAPWLTNAGRLSMSPLLGSGGPWYLVDASGSPDKTKLVATDYADLTDGALGTAITIDEAGQTIVTLLQAWTATQPDGNKVSRTNACVNWTSKASGHQGLTGDPTRLDGDWTEHGTIPCDGVARLYCFERAP